MHKSFILYPPIGIAGAARSGKDTLCKGLISYFNSLNIQATRRSIAGDTVKSDLKDLLSEKFNINSFTEDFDEKESIRPLLVEYGKLQRLKSKGRYFIEKFEFTPEYVNIIPDIRYVEYPEDEVNWLKNQVNGLLIFIRRKGVFDANDTEKVNNKIIKNYADIQIEWDTLKEEDELFQHAKNIVENYYKLHFKKVTTYSLDS